MHTALATAVAAALALGGGVACAGDGDHSARPSGSAAPDAATAAVRAEPAAPTGRRVLVVSVDGLNTRAIQRLGRDRAPHLHRIMRQGSGTLNARTLRERTQTLPNHTGMLTGRRVRAASGGHGVRFNRDTGTTVHRAAGERVRSVPNVVHAAGGRTAVITTKAKFALFRRSWPTAIDHFRVARDDEAAVDHLLARGRRDTWTLLHLSAPDAAGHAHRFMSKAYLAAVRDVDAQLGRILDHLDEHPRQRAGLHLLVTSDHGGIPGKHAHAARTQLQAYRVPLLVWGDEVAHGDLYEMNPAFRDPGRRRTSYDGRQPIRNAAVANLSTSILELPAVPGSTVDRRQRLTVH